MSSVVGLVLGGSRPLAGEVQALVSRQHEKATTPPMRQANGLDKQRFYQVRALMTLPIGRDGVVSVASRLPSRPIFPPPFSPFTVKRPRTFD